MIGDFFLPIGNKRRAIEVLIDDINFDEQIKKKKERTEAFDKDKKMRLEATRAERNETIANAKKRREPLSHDQLVSDQINQIVDADDDLSDTLAAKVAKKWSKRPANWIDIVEEANKFSSSEAIKNYRLEFLASV